MICIICTCLPIETCMISMICHDFNGRDLREPALTHNVSMTAEYDIDDLE